jgi:hypothetical protein
MPMVNKQVVAKLNAFWESKKRTAKVLGHSK